jgi:hypothetical protein
VADGDEAESADGAAEEVLGRALPRVLLVELGGVVRLRIATVHVVRLRVHLGLNELGVDRVRGRRVNDVVPAERALAP